MSLINEALKKAQKQQRDAAANGIGSIAPPDNPPIDPPKPPQSAPAAASPEPEPDPIVSARRRRKSGGLGKWAWIAVFVIVIGGVGFGLNSNKTLEPSTSEVETPVIALTEAPPTQEESAPVEAGEAAAVELASDIQTEAEVVAISSEQPVEISLPPALVVTPAPETTIEKEAPRPVREHIVVTEPVSKPTAKPVDLPPAPAPVAKTKPEAVRTAPATSTPSPELAAADLVTDGAMIERPPSAAPARPVGKVVIDTADEPSVSHVTQNTQTNNVVLDYLERARVTGIRVSATDPKVLMNNRVYRLNEIVDRDLQLRIVHIAPRELRFEDPSGHVYRKTF